jgi:lysozyme
LKKQSNTWNTEYPYFVGALILSVIFLYGKMKAKKQIVTFEGQNYQKKLFEFLTKEEGVRNRVYKDQAGFDTIGIGHKIQKGEERLLSVTLTPKEIEDLFFLDIIKFESAIANSVKVPLNDNQKIALVSLAFNIGTAAFQRSSLLRFLNQRKYREASLEFPKWKFITLNGKKVVSKGLEARRFREQLLFNS